MNLYSRPIVIVDDQEDYLRSCSLFLRSEQFEDVRTVQNPKTLIPVLEQNPASLVLLDLNMPEMNGSVLLPLIKEKFPSTAVMVITALNDVDTAVECLKAGADDFLTKPFDYARLVTSVTTILEKQILQEKLEQTRSYLSSSCLQQEEVFAGIVSVNPRMRDLFAFVESIAASREPVLLTGETGTGKELFAKAVHDVSGVKGKFIPVNVAGLDDNMFADTLFGHKRGAFTGADGSRDGLIVKAENGTLFLDEIGDMSEASQVKLLRLLQDKSYYPLGDDTPRKTNARIIVATNRDLQQMIGQGTFRQDLFYRIRTHMIHLPPLRERMEDVPALVEHFVQLASESLGKKSPAIPLELYTLLKTYTFPGNVRELSALVYNAVTVCRGGKLGLDTFKMHMNGSCMRPADTGSLSPNIESVFGGRFPKMREIEDFIVDKAMESADNNQGVAANLLGITRQALNKRLNNRVRKQKPQ